MKKAHSWSKPYLTNLIGRKKVDWSIFRYGSAIPKIFHEEFFAANLNEELNRGETKPLKLLINGTTYEATLTNIDRKNANTSLQIRYDQNTPLIELLEQSFAKTYEYIKGKRNESPNKTIIVPDEEAEYIDFYRTSKPYEYEVVFRTKEDMVSKPSFWWVNLGETYREARADGYIWAPKLSKNGRTIGHHVRLLEANIGDIVFCYASLELRAFGIVKQKAKEAKNPYPLKSDEWERDGRLVELEYFDIHSVIERDEIPLDWRLNEKEGPFDKNGNINQGYFYSVSDNFVHKFLNLFEDRVPEEIKSGILDELEEKEITKASQIKDPELDYLTNEQIIDHIDTYIKSKGFLYSKEEIINLYLSLKTKPFVILSGISGTGKTMIVKLFAESVGANEDNGQFTLIPVRPDWNDGSDLLGYVDIKGEFNEGPLTKAIKRANKQPELPYFVLLDEMNLARVEHYFSDILSVMESKEWIDGKIVSSKLLDHEQVGMDLILPDNLYVIGTVNMDETTHPFSKKVLDRANTIEFNRIDLGNLAFLEDLEKVQPKKLRQRQLASKYLVLKDVYANYKDVVQKVTHELSNINGALEVMYAQIGYRVRDEISFYMAYNEEESLLPFNEAMDHCILQKILPRIAGSDARVDQLLRELYKQFTGKQYDERLADFVVDIETAKYPQSALKVLEMLRRLEVDGFTSFWIS